MEKRRSGRNTKRKKYVDDVEYNFSDEEMKKLPKDTAQAAKTAAMNDILGPEEAKEGASLDVSLDGESQTGPNYAFVVRFYFIYIFFYIPTKRFRRY